MSKFRFQAFDAAGSLIEGEIDSETEEKARDLVWSRGVTPFAVYPSQRPVSPLPQSGFAWSFAWSFSWPFSWRPSRVNDARLASMVRDLSILLQAGVPLESALRSIASASADKRVQALARRLLDSVLGGSTFADAMAGTELALQEYVKIAQAGELSGDLGGGLKELADLMERRIEIRGQIRTALTYPVLLLALAAVSIAAILGLLIPTITPIFLDNNQPLPLPIAFLEAARANLSLILSVSGIAAALMALAIAMARRNPEYAAQLDRLYLRIPVIGPISELREAARFTRTLATLIKSGVPLLHALAGACPLINNAFTRNALERATAQVSEGVSLAGAFAKAAALPPIAVEMIAVGEESGRLPDMFSRLAAVLEQNERDRTARALAILGPLITISVAGTIAAVILPVVSSLLAINDFVLR
ncbi:MAG: type II secretion system F family protein [Hyphomicrobiales bacterium]|nr:type II secretion system F family protein [Hyphomicrobiales bacterium]